MLCLKKLNIEPLMVPEFTQEQNQRVTDYIEGQLQSWAGTPYFPGQAAKGRGVDCVHFVTAVYDSILGTEYTYEKLPQDASFHDKDGAEAGMRRLIRMYPCDPVEGDTVQPGDVVICGPIGICGGPGHAMIAGADALWHVDAQAVCRAGLVVAQRGSFSFRQIRRFKDRYNIFKRLAEGA